MNKLKKILLTVALVCLTVSASIILAACGSDKDINLSFINPQPSSSEYDGKYVISVQSMGGLPLDGVAVTAKKDGAEVISGVSQNGEIHLNIEAGEYELEVDETRLPAGYYVPEDATFKTDPDKTNASIVLPSTVIPTTASANVRYKLGDVMYNFGFADTTGEQYTLSQVLATKKAVILNFWYTTCGPCRTEFPAIQKAYESYGDKVAIIALDMMDSMQDIVAFKDEQQLTFYMGPDQAGVTNLFGVNAFPTTVVVDRYGVVAYISSGTAPNVSTWLAMFNTYTADDYVQSKPSDEGNDVPANWATPAENLVQPSSDEIAAVIGGVGTTDKVHNFREETSEKDAENSFPWLISEDGRYVYASNAKVSLSYATMYCDVTLENGDVLSYEYNVNTESGGDILYVFIDGELAAEHSGDSEGWAKNYGLYVANRSVTLTLTFFYVKDAQHNTENEIVAVRNIEITDVSENTDTYDKLISAVNGKQLSGGKYNVNILEPETDENPDIYYKIKFTDSDGNEQTSILYADMLKVTQWSDLHVGVKRFVSPTLERYIPSMYMLSYWGMSNYETAVSDERLIFTYGYSETIIDTYYYQTFSDNSYMPVYKDLKDAMVAFTKQYQTVANAYYAENGIDKTVEYYDDQWLELCYYYEHHGGKDLIGYCNTNHDPIDGLAQFNAYTLNGSSAIVTVDKIISYKGGGKWYKFTPSQSGVYNFYSSYYSTDRTVDPSIVLFDETLTEIGYNNNDESYNHFSKVSTMFNLYARLEQGKTYYVQACTAKPGDTGTYRLNVNYVGDSYSYLRVCSTGDGSWATETLYNGIKVALSPNDGYYHAWTDNNEYGETIYIDFRFPNYYDQKNHSLYEIIKAGVFNFGRNENYTEEMLGYYYRSMKGKPTTSELYGMIEADERLVYILNRLIYHTFGDSPEAYGWLMFANYYVHY